MRRRGTRPRAVAIALLLAVAAPAAATGPTTPPPVPVLADGTTTRLSVRADGTEATEPVDASLDAPSISADGRYVAFDTMFALGLGHCGPGVYLRDLKSGKLEMVSVPARGCHRDYLGAGSSGSHTAITPGGRYVAFGSGARDLLPGRPLRKLAPSGVRTEQVFVRDRRRARTVLVSVGYDGQPANASATRPSISDDGRFVVFESPATNLIRGDRGDPLDEGRTDVFLRDLHRGVTVRVGPDVRRHNRGAKYFPSLSGNGRFVTFDADDGHVAPHKGREPGLLAAINVIGQVWVWDRITRTTELVSRTAAGYVANGSTTYGGYTGSNVSRDGRWITYVSNARNLVGPQTGITFLYDELQVYLFDRVTKTTTRVTHGLAGEGGNGNSREPCISPNGRYVTYSSAASNLGDVDLTPTPAGGRFTDFGVDIYLYDRVTNRTRLVSRSSEGVPADGGSLESCPSDDGRAVVFVSDATNLVPGDTNGDADLFLRRYDTA